MSEQWGAILSRSRRRLSRFGVYQTGGYVAGIQGDQVLGPAGFEAASRGSTA
jgi:hypothetical protein